MKKVFDRTFLFISSALLIAGCTSKNSKAERQHKPNVLIILTDDMGYGDISCYGQKNYKTPDIFPTLLSLTNVTPSKQNVLDGKDITEILKGNQTTHDPVFSMHNSNLMSVRKGDWKLFLHNPGYFKKIDLSKWKDPRAPDGKTIIASPGQATPAQYPGIIPVKTENEIQLYNLKNDPTESNDLSNVNPEKVKELLQDGKKFEASCTPLK